MGVTQRDRGGTPACAADFSLTPAELREVTTFAASAAARVLPLFEADRPDDPRPREALDAAWAFARGGPRSRLQRVTGPGAHRAAKECASPPAFHAAMAAGDAAASAFLHPLADAAQVGHILRAPAHAILAVQRSDDAAGTVEPLTVETVARAATPLLVEILRRYPATAPGARPVARLVHELDVALRGAVGGEAR